MSEKRNPFGEREAGSESTSVGRLLFTLAGTLILIVGGVGAWMLFQQQTLKTNRILTELERVRTQASQSQAEAAELKEKLTASHVRVSDLEKEKEVAAQTHQGLEEEMRAELESKDVTISQLQGKLTVNILDRILFDSGEAILKSPGQDVLQKIAAILVEHPSLRIHVIGHTDNVPIRPHARSRFASNWELSSARALAAVRFLTETAGVDPHRVGAVAYGEFHPSADNSTVEGRAKNRRIAITILPDELAGADIVPTAKSNAPAAVTNTNSAPATFPPTNPPQANSAPVAVDSDKTAPEVK